MQITSTENYSVFNKINGNRRLNKSHIARLKESISRDAESIKYTPILVNENMEVIDGQHRLEAIKSLGFPVHYIKIDGLKLENAQTLNSLSKPWTPMDYAKSYSEIGNKHYQIYIDFKLEYQLNHDVLLSYLGLENPISSQMFKVGKFKAKDSKASHKLCKALLDLGEFYEGFKRRGFALAFKTMWSNDGYNHEYFLGKLKIHGSKLTDHSVPEEYLRSLEKIYNSHLRNESERVRFF